MAVLDNVSNPDKIQGNITGTGVKLGPYRWRAGNDTPSTLRVEVTGTFTGTVQLQLCTPGAVSGYVVDSYTAPETVVLEPGGHTDIYMVGSGWSSGTAVCGIFSGKR